MLANGSATSTTPLLNINTRKEALEAMAVLDENFRRIESELGVIGAAVSRLGAALGTLQAYRDNETAAYSRIMDADMAHETAVLLRAQILQQASAAVLSQANQEPALALRLLTSRE